MGSIYSLVAVAVTGWAAVRSRRDPQDPLVWMALIIVATLRSPFLPQAYGALPPLWLLVLLGARAAPTARSLAVVLALWVGLDLYWPLDWPMDVRGLALLSSIPQVLTLAVAGFALRPLATHAASAARSPDRAPWAPAGA